MKWKHKRFLPPTHLWCFCTYLFCHFHFWNEAILCTNHKAGHWWFHWRFSTALYPVLLYLVDFGVPSVLHSTKKMKINGWLSRCWHSFLLQICLHNFQNDKSFFPNYNEGLRVVGADKAGALAIKAMLAVMHVECCDCFENNEKYGKYEKWQQSSKRSTIISADEQMMASTQGTL